MRTRAPIYENLFHVGLLSAIMAMLGFVQLDVDWTVRAQQGQCWLGQRWSVSASLSGGAGRIARSAPCNEVRDQPQNQRQNGRPDQFYHGHHRKVGRGCRDFINKHEVGEQENRQKANRDNPQDNTAKRCGSFGGS